MFLTGTLLNVATVLVGTAVGVLLGTRVPSRVNEALTTGLGFFTLLLAISMGLGVFTSPDARAGDDLAVLAAVLGGVAIGELLRLDDGLEWIGGWFQRRLATSDRPSRIAEGFVTASLVFCVGPLTILGSLDNGLTFIETITDWQPLESLRTPARTVHPAPAQCQGWSDGYRSAATPTTRRTARWRCRRPLGRPLAT